jgi:hypothetical protein
MFLFCSVTVPLNFADALLVFVLGALCGLAFLGHKKRTADFSEVLFIGGPRAATP